MSTVPRAKKPLQPVAVVGRFLQAPVCPCEIVPLGTPGVLAIDSTPYLCSILGELPAAGEPLVHGYQVVKADGAVYHIDTRTAWGQWQCDCPDGTYRGERPGGCKHVAALRQALQCGTRNAECGIEGPSFIPHSALRTPHSKEGSAA